MCLIDHGKQTLLLSFGERSTLLQHVDLCLKITCVLTEFLHHDSQIEILLAIPHLDESSRKGQMFHGVHFVTSHTVTFFRV